MKKLNWKQWIAISLIAAVIIIGIILHLVQPEVTYAWLELISGGTFILGGITGYLLKKNSND